MMAVLASGCGGSSAEPASSGGSSSVKESTAAAGTGAGVTIKAAQFSWSAAGLTNAILAQIAKEKPELGVAKITTTQLDPATAWAGAARGDLDLITEVALPNQQKFADSAKDKMSVISQTYGNAQQGWFVPKYVLGPGGAAAGLTSISQLNKFKKVFGGKFYDDDPGYVTTEQNTKRLKGYGVEYQHVIATEAAELAQLKAAYTRKKPILLYLYHPHWVFAQYDMVMLQEPKPYVDGCLTTGDGACAMPAYSANIAGSAKLKEQAPKFVAMLSKFSITLDEMEKMQKAVDIDKTDVTTVASGWVSEHKSQIDNWSAS